VGRGTETLWWVAAKDSLSSQAGFRDSPVGTVKSSGTHRHVSPEAGRRNKGQPRRSDSVSAAQLIAGPALDLDSELPTVTPAQAYCPCLCPALSGT
jgi:hypothetical protein